MADKHSKPNCDTPTNMTKAAVVENIMRNESNGAYNEDGEHEKFQH